MSARRAGMKGAGKAIWCMTAVQAEVVADFVGDQEGHLSLKIGDMVTIIAQNPDGWWAGALRGQIGTFPASCVNQISSLPGSNPAPPPSSAPVSSIKPTTPQTDAPSPHGDIPVPPRPAGRLTLKRMAEKTSQPTTPSTNSTSNPTTTQLPTSPKGPATPTVSRGGLAGRGSGGIPTTAGNAEKRASSSPRNSNREPPLSSSPAPELPAMPPIPPLKIKLTPEKSTGGEDRPEAVDDPGGTELPIEDEDLVFVDTEPEAPPLLPVTELPADSSDDEDVVENAGEDPSAAATVNAEGGSVVTRTERTHSVTERSQRAEHKRQEIINELVSTERDYVRDLNITINVFLIPLKSAKIISDQDIALLFSNIMSIRTVNRQFYNNLLMKIRSQSSAQPTTPIGDIFADMADYFKMYTVYCANHPRALEAKNRLIAKNPNFKKFLRLSESDAACHNLQFTDYLIKPIQRICKYPMLLQELVKYTEPEHEDFMLLTGAEKKIKEVVEHIDNAAKKIEANHQVLEIQMYIGDNTLLNSKPKFVREALVTMYPPGQQAKAEDLVLYVFEEYLILCKPRKPKFLQKRKRTKNCFEPRTIPIGDLKLINLTTQDFFAFELDRGERQGMFLVNICERMVFQCKTAEETSSVHMEIHRVIKNATVRRLRDMNKQEKEDDEPVSPKLSGGSTIQSAPKSARDSANYGKGDAASNPKAKRTLSARGLPFLLMRGEKEKEKERPLSTAGDSGSKIKNLEKAAEVFKKQLDEEDKPKGERRDSQGGGTSEATEKKSSEADELQESMGLWNEMGSGFNKMIQTSGDKLGIPVSPPRRHTETNAPRPENIDENEGIQVPERPKFSKVGRSVSGYASVAKGSGIGNQRSSLDTPHVNYGSKPNMPPGTPPAVPKKHN